MTGHHRKPRRSGPPWWAWWQTWYLCGALVALVLITLRPL